MEPTIKGYLWDIPFYPMHNSYRTVKQIFWYDSSDEMAFVKFDKEYQILIPEHLIKATPQDIQWVHDNINDIWENKLKIIKTDNQGNWTLRL
jgi:hypothetical protein